MLEWLWHVDERDQPLGRIERARAHREQLRHRSGVVFLLDADGRVFLTQRAASKPLWPQCHDTSASFHVSYGESYAQAAVRETREELGIAVSVRYVERFHHVDPPELQWVALFVASYDGSALRLDDQEAASGSFVTLDEATRRVRDEACTPWLRDGLPRLRAYLRV